jgi:hypothetical protein
MNLMQKRCGLAAPVAAPEAAAGFRPAESRCFGIVARGGPVMTADDRFRFGVRLLP